MEKNRCRIETASISTVSVFSFLTFSHLSATNNCMKSEALNLNIGRVHVFEGRNPLLKFKLTSGRFNM